MYEREQLEVVSCLRSVDRLFVCTRHENVYLRVKIRCARLETTAKSVAVMLGRMVMSWSLIDLQVIFYTEKLEQKNDAFLHAPKEKECANETGIYPIIFVWAVLCEKVRIFIFRCSSSSLPHFSFALWTLPVSASLRSLTNKSTKNCRRLVAFYSWPVCEWWMQHKRSLSGIVRCSGQEH